MAVMHGKDADADAPADDDFLAWLSLQYQHRTLLRWACGNGKPAFTVRAAPERDAAEPFAGA
jgi:hypothetical protein